LLVTRFRLGIRQDDQREESVAIPASAFRLLVDILTEMAHGNAVTLILDPHPPS
jgi:hypothetical protein